MLTSGRQTGIFAGLRIENAPIGQAPWMQGIGWRLVVICPGFLEAQTDQRITGIGIGQGNPRLGDPNAGLEGGMEHGAVGLGCKRDKKFIPALNDSRLGGVIGVRNAIILGQRPAKGGCPGKALKVSAVRVEAHQVPGVGRVANGIAIGQATGGGVKLFVGVSRNHRAIR